MNACTIVDINSEKNEIKKENFPYLNGIFKEDSENAWNSINDPYFPKNNLTLKTNHVAFVQLLFLACIKEGHETSIFTKKQIKIFKKSTHWDNGTSFSLRSGIVINSLIFIAIALFPLIPTSSDQTNATSSQEENSNNFSPTEKGLIFTAAFIGVLTNAISFWATGFSPNSLSNASNIKQDVLSGIKTTFQNLATRLTMLYFSDGKNEASKIAHNISIATLKDQCFELTKNSEKTAQIITPLNEAVEYIKNQQLPGNAALLSLILLHKKSI